jgi:hypothetical protein
VWLYGVCHSCVEAFAGAGKRSGDFPNALDAVTVSAEGNEVRTV